jgi:Legionella pneumophila major outer membrane protein precursor
MRWDLRSLLLALSVVGLGSEARAQSNVMFRNSDVAAPSTTSRNFSLRSADDIQIIDGTPIFREQTPSSPLASANTGRVNGSTVSGVDGTNTGHLSVGFDYIRPWWTFSDFNAIVPPVYASTFPAFASIGSTDNHFAFVPRVQYDYYLANVDFGVSASGKVINLQGGLQRTLASAGGVQGNLVSNANLTIVSINPVEFWRPFDFDELFGDKHRKEHFEDSQVLLAIGSRFVQMNQNYSGTLQTSGTGTNVASRYTTQNYSGFGLTAAANWKCPLSRNFIGFTDLRGSILAGENRRNSSLNIVATGQTGVADTIAETKTQWLPIAELEMGIEWGQDLGELLRNRESRQLITVRVAGLGQFWGGMGPLSAGSTQGFRTSDLFLAGVSVQVGFRH